MVQFDGHYASLLIRLSTCILALPFVFFLSTKSLLNDLQHNRIDPNGKKMYENNCFFFFAVVICAPNSRSDTTKTFNNCPFYTIFFLLIVIFVFVFFFGFLTVKRQQTLRASFYHIIQRLYNGYCLRPYKLTMEMLCEMRAQNQHTHSFHIDGTQHQRMQFSSGIRSIAPR